VHERKNKEREHVQDMKKKEKMGTRNMNEKKGEQGYQ
jgi:hypothetical protein